jgi:hypothetical protein
LRAFESDSESWQAVAAKPPRASGIPKWRTNFFIDDGSRVPVTVTLTLEAIGRIGRTRERGAQEPRFELLAMATEDQ